MDTKKITWAVIAIVVLALVAWQLGWLGGKKQMTEPVPAPATTTEAPAPAPATPPATTTTP